MGADGSRDPRTIGQHARMDVPSKYLYDDGVGGASPAPWVEYLDSGEILQYLLIRQIPAISMEIEDPTGNSETYETTETDTVDYFLVTDRRIRFVPENDGRHILAEEFHYGEIVSARYNEGMTKDRITLQLDDGNEVHVWHYDVDMAPDWEQLTDYIENRRQYCPTCGVAISGQEVSCPGCGVELETVSCDACGTVLGGGEDYCMGCGEPV